MTPTATVRFYAELNDFLRGDQRQRDTCFPFVMGRSVKDAIEGLGVPHTEVDLILVNGQPVDFGYRLADGDRVSAYPLFKYLDISAVTPLRPQPLHELRFIVDGHLGTLARYLRLLGFDTIFDPDLPDNELAARSGAERRILLTRDRGLLKRRAVTHAVFVRWDDPDEQLLELVHRLPLGANLRPFTRCMVCNGLLEDAHKATVADRLEARTRASFHRFRQCGVCGRVYWEGSHQRRLLDLLERVRAESTSSDG
jgi:uncharacterized protein with PIN domain